jgi:hypothetical protein
MAVMHEMGLPLLPSSVMVKQNLIAANASDSPSLLVSAVNALRKSAEQFTHYPPAWILVLLIVAVALHPLLRVSGYRAIREPHHFGLRQEFVFAGAIVFTLGAHVLLGGWGGNYRYEIYATMAGAAAATILWHAQIAQFVERSRPLMVAAVAAAFLMVNVYYVWATGRSPVASLGIYEQQYQMHRFATEFYARPVAVNDLGWVSYHNPNYVLDLWGLGSEEARKARVVEKEPGWMGRLAKEHHVGLAMVYAQWFNEDIPAGWTRLAVLKTPHRTAASFPVTFYVTSPEALPDAMDALRRFTHVMPSGDELTIIGASVRQANADR